MRYICNTLYRVTRPNQFIGLFAVCRDNRSLHGNDRNASSVRTRGISSEIDHSASRRPSIKKIGPFYVHVCNHFLLELQVECS
jgi:hypothetical protein